MVIATRHGPWSRAARLSCVFHAAYLGAGCLHFERGVLRRTGTRCPPVDARFSESMTPLWAAVSARVAHDAMI